MTSTFEKLPAILCTALCLLITNTPNAQEAELMPPIFSAERGFHDNAFDVTVSAISGAIIKYTFDGTDPRTSRTAFSQPAPATITIDPDDYTGRDRAPGVVVRACAVHTDFPEPSAPVTQTYIFLNRIISHSPDGQRPGAGWPQQNTGFGKNINYGMDPQVVNSTLYRDKIEAALVDIPTFSMVMDLNDLFDSQRGIYMNALQHGREWERPCSIELIYPDGTEGFQVNCGVRIRGGWSRNNSNPKHAFRWFFRKEYGPGKLRYPMFGDEGVDEFDNLDLRTSQNYSWSYGAEDPSKNTMNRDVFSRDLQRDMGQPYTRSRYYHLYINGTYWGLYQTQERAEASFGASYFGGEKEDYDVVKVDGGYQGRFVIEATDGTLDAWRRLWEASIEGFETAGAYYKIQGMNPDGTRNPDYEVLLDVDNLIDFMLNVFVTGDPDGPISNFINNNRNPNNFYALFNRNDSRGFIFLRHDAEHTLGAQAWGEDRTGPFPAGQTFKTSNPQWIHQKLVENPLYVSRFADHVYKHFFNNGALTSGANIERFLARKEEIDLAIIAESARWGDSKREPAFTRDGVWLAEINRIVRQFFPGRTQTVLNQLKSKGWYPDVTPPVLNRESGLVEAGVELTMTSSEGDIYYTTDGSDPYQPADLESELTVAISENTTKRALVPVGNIGTPWRTDLSFDDSAWKSGQKGVGYDNSSDYVDDIGINVNEMYNGNSSCYVRVKFSLTADQLDSANYLALNMMYDDGFAAFLNGERVADANAPATLAWNSSSTTTSAEASSPLPVNLSAHIKLLKAGENLLAIQGLNAQPGSSAFLVWMELVVGKNALNEGKPSLSAVIYDAPVPITETTTVKARTVLNGEWSALSQAEFWVQSDFENLKVTEIHYHPLDLSDIDDREFEFLEFKNTGSEALNISGVTISQGISYTFPAGTVLAGGEYIVLASNAAQFEIRYKFKPFGEYDGQLGNDSDTLTVQHPDGGEILTISYSDGYPWPNSADGAGYSLVPKDENPYGNQNDADAWIASKFVHGSPNQSESKVAVQEPNAALPENFELFQNYPNPFNPSTAFSFSVAQKSKVTLEIFNILGQKIATVVDGTFEPGQYNTRWQPQSLASGIYFYRLQAGNFMKTRKLLFLP